MRRYLLILLMVAMSVLAMSSQDVRRRGFTWGADIGSSIDMSGNDISTVDADAYFGYRSPFFRTIAVGAGIHTSLGSSNTIVPVFLLIRTSFTTKPSLCFMELKGGYSFNSLQDNESQQGAFGQLGLGFNLYTGRKFRSHLVLGYNFYQLHSYEEYELGNLHCASVKIGISF